MRASILRTLPPLALMALVTGCASRGAPPPDIATDVEAVGMPNAELALQRSLARVDGAIGQLGGMRVTAQPRPMPAKTVPPARPATDPPTTVPGAPIPLVPSPEAALASRHPVGEEPVLPDELRRPIAFAWYGSLDEGAKRLADLVGYKLVISGPAKRGPIDVTIQLSSTPAIAAFRALGEQAGNRATVLVDPENQRVEVLHHV